MKICCVIPSLAFGGMERVMSNLINYFAEDKNQEVYLILYGINRDIKYEISKKIKVLRPDFIFNNNKRLVSTLRTMLWLRKTIKNITPDKVLSFGEYWNNFVLLSLYRTKYPVFISDRSQPDLNLGRINNFLRKKLYPHASGIICQTTKSYEIMKERIHHNNMIVIGNPIRDVEIKNGNLRENIVLSIGRLINTKHFDRLISIFSKIDVPGWKLIIIGGDSLKQSNMKKLTDLISNLGMCDKIILEGYKSNIEDYLLKSKIFAFTSSSEGFPNVVGEAMSAGLPVVSYDCVAGPSDMIQNGDNGYLVPVFDDETFQNKVRILMENENLRLKMSQNAKLSMERFSNEKICNLFYEFITK